MHTFKIPRNIEIKTIDGKPLGWAAFKRWFQGTVLDDERIGISPAKLARAVIMSEAVEKSVVEKDFNIEDADYEACKPIVLDPRKMLVIEVPNPNGGEPGRAAGPLISAQMLPFATAFLEAKKS